jgi:MFS family permease
VSFVSGNEQSITISASPQGRVQALHRETREELNKADAKATTLTSIVGLILGAFLAGAIAGDFTPQRFSDGIEWLFWTGVVLASAAEVALCLAVFPRRKPKGSKEELEYFAQVAQFKTIETFKAALLEAGNEFERLASQVYVLSKIVVHKYTLIRMALLMLAAGVLCCTASALLDHYFF